MFISSLAKEALMQIIVETPKWSFRKLEQTSRGYERIFSSPTPTPFNYGFIDGTKGDDGMPLDVVILGEKLAEGTKIEASIIGRVVFIDDGIRDDKYIATLDGKRHEMAIRIFFTVYAMAKLVLRMIRLRRWTKNRFEGVEWFEESVKDANALRPLAPGTGLEPTATR